MVGCAGLLRVCGCGWMGAGGRMRVRACSSYGFVDRRSRQLTVVKYTRSNVKIYCLPIIFHCQQLTDISVVSIGLCRAPSLASLGSAGGNSDSAKTANFSRHQADLSTYFDEMAFAMSSKPMTRPRRDRSLAGAPRWPYNSIPTKKFVTFAWL
jgi:hypothetical protein